MYIRVLKVLKELLSKHYAKALDRAILGELRSFTESVTGTMEKTAKDLSNTIDNLVSLEEVVHPCCSFLICFNLD